jgi:hypothetical protein
MNQHQKRSILKELILFFFALSWSACSTYQVIDIDILTPSPYQISPAVQHLTIINNAQEQASTLGHNTYKQDASYNTYSVKKRISKDNIKVDSTTTTAVYNMYNHLEESHLFSSVTLGKKKPYPHIPYGKIDKTFQSHPSDAILFLESLTYTDDKSYLYYEYFDVEATEIRVLTKSQWLLYYADNSKRPYRFTVNDTLFWNQEDVDRAACVIEGVWNNAKLSAEKIIPYWKSVNRLYYTGAKLIYREVDEALKTQTWEQAGKLWISLYNSERKNTKQKGKMAFNMALFFEMKNDVTTSAMWLETAIEIFTEKNAQNELEMCSLYLTVLNNRLLNQERLDQQYTR